MHDVLEPARTYTVNRAFPSERLDSRAKAKGVSRLHTSSQTHAPDPERSACLSHSRLRLRLLRGLALALVASFGFATAALGGNDHVHNGVYLGYGDGTDLDGYAHPFVDYPNSQWKIADFFVNTALWNPAYGWWECYGHHEHYTSGYGSHIHYSDSHGSLSSYEDTWYANVGSASPSVGYHTHQHHYPRQCVWP